MPDSKESILQQQNDDSSTQSHIRSAKRADNPGSEHLTIPIGHQTIRKHEEAGVLGGRFAGLLSTPICHRSAQKAHMRARGSALLTPEHTGWDNERVYRKIRRVDRNARA